jgi:ORF6N domain
MQHICSFAASQSGRRMYLQFAVTRQGINAMVDPGSIVAVTEQIRLVRGYSIMLDADLAGLFGVETERLNRQVKRNAERFPDDFMFQLTQAEWRAMYRQFGGTSQHRRRLDRLPLAFTEHGCLMLANVLRSSRAVEVSVLIVRAFVRLRAAVLPNNDLARRVDELGVSINTELGKHRSKLATHERAILKLLEDIRRLTHFPESHGREIGFMADWRK